MSRQRAQRGAARPGARPLAPGFTTKIHAKADNSGDVIAFDLTRGQVADTTRFETLLDIGSDITPRAALGDKGYSSKANRAAQTRGVAPVIPHKANEKSRPAFFAKTLYKEGCDTVCQVRENHSASINRQMS